MPLTAQLALLTDWPLKSIQLITKLPPPPQETPQNNPVTTEPEIKTPSPDTPTLDPTLRLSCVKEMKDPLALQELPGKLIQDIQTDHQENSPDSSFEVSPK